MNQKEKKGRGAQINPAFKCAAFVYDNTFKSEAKFPIDSIEVHPETVLNKKGSPDMGIFFSLDPYQDYEHG